MTTDEIEEQAEIIKRLSVDPVYDILTRSGLEYLAWPVVAEKATYVIFCDIDNMKGLNFQYTYDGMNERIKKSLHSRVSRIGRKPDVGRWFSGDEILWIICEGDPKGLAESIQKEMKKNGFSATFGIALVRSLDLVENVRDAIGLVEQAKKNNQRGTISLAK